MEKVPHFCSKNDMEQTIFSLERFYSHHKGVRNLNYIKVEPIKIFYLKIHEVFEEKYVDGSLLSSLVLIKAVFIAKMRSKNG